MSTIRIPRSCASVLLALVLAFTGTVVAGSESSPRITQLTPSEADSQFSSPFTGFGVAVAIRGGTAWVGIPLYINSDEAPTQSGRVGIFTLDQSTDAWIRSGSLDVTDQRDGERLFGSTVVLLRHDAAVGSSGAVRIYSKTPQGWNVLAKITSDAPNRVLGPVLAYDGSTLAVQVTETLPQSRPTFVYVYEIDHHGAARLMGKLSAPPGDTGAFGSSLALDDHALLVGSPPGYSASSPLAPGAAYVYSRHEGTWHLMQQLHGRETSDNSDFGAAVAIHRDVILVGAPFDDVVSENDFTTAAGAVYVFREGHHGSWVETQRVRPEQDFVGVFRGFGWSLAMADERVAIGAPLPTDPFQSELGQTDVYHWEGKTLVFEQKIPAFPSPGFSLSMWQEQLIIGVDAFVHAPINEAWIVDFGSNAGP